MNEFDYGRYCEWVSHNIKKLSDRFDAYIKECDQDGEWYAIPIKFEDWTIKEWQQWLKDNLIYLK